MAQWTRILFVAFSFPALVTSSRVDTRSSNSRTELQDAIPEETKDALLGWLHRKEYRYLIMTLPKMTVETGAQDKNFADFQEHLLRCPGVCIAAYDFTWQAPRGQGTVTSSEPVLFSWAPDQPAVQMGMMAYMKLKMQMPMKKELVKEAMGDWNGAFIQANSKDELSPDWFVPKLRGGRMGSRIEKLNPEGKALWAQLKKEIGEGSIGESIPFPDESPQPDTGNKPAPKPVNPPAGRPMTGSKEQVENFITQMVDRAFDKEKSKMVEQAKQAARTAVEQRPSDDIDVIAKAAAEEAVTEMFKSLSDKLNSN